MEGRERSPEFHIEEDHIEKAGEIIGRGSSKNIGRAGEDQKKEIRGFVLKIELSDTDLERVVKALEWYYFYTLAQKREDGSFRDLADRLKRKEPRSETRTTERAKKRG